MGRMYPLEAAGVRAARSGDARALEDLLRALAGELMPLASALAAGSGEADSLVGDTISRVYEHIDQLHEDGAILPWARRILMRRFLDRRRWSLRRPNCSIESVEVPAPVVPGPEIFDLRQAVSRLAPEDRALLVLHYWQASRSTSAPPSSASRQVPRSPG